MARPTGIEGVGDPWGTHFCRLLFQNMLDGFAYCRMLFDERGRPEDFVYLDVNGAFERLTGLHDVVGKRVSEVIPGIREAHPELLETYGRVVRTGQPERFEIDLRPLGIWLSVAVYSPHADHFVAVFDNITARKRAEAEVRAANAQLTEAGRRKDEFLGMLSHELRNPLAPIRNSVFILEHADANGEQARRARAVIKRQAEHLTRLVDDLLDVTRIARGKIELRRGRVDLAELVRRAADDHATLMRQRGIELAIDVSGEPLWAEGDSTRLAQVVGNLLHNAAKFTPHGGRVSLVLEEVRGAAEIHVRDSGVGIEPGLLMRVFEPFVQGERTLARTDGGLGLGLALVKGVTELHGGSVRAASAGAGQGSEFVVRLPLVEVGVSGGAARPAAACKDASRRVLVVDDNEDAAGTLAQLVEMFGHTAEVAYDGPSAIAKARAHPPDVIFCDIGLPEMSGYDVVRMLRGEEALRRTQIFAVSGYAQPEDRKRAVDAGFDGHIAKPSDPAEIERLLS